MSSPTAAAAPDRTALELGWLPRPRLSGDVPLEQAIERRASVREFAAGALRTKEISQLLWACQGITHGRDGRSAPSAGALYPLQLYLATRDGLFLYEPHDHRLALAASDDLRSPLAQAAGGQSAIEHAAAVVAFTADASRTAAKYGRRAARFATLEVGHAAQNLLLQAAALRLGAVPVGAFDDEEVSSVLDLPHGHVPVYLIAVGHPVQRC